MKRGKLSFSIELCPYYNLIERLPFRAEFCRKAQVLYREVRSKGGIAATFRFNFTEAQREVLLQLANVDSLFSAEEFVEHVEDEKQLDVLK